MARIRILLTLLICSLAASSWAEPFTLKACEARARAENHQLKAYALSIGEAREGVNSAFSDFLPTLGLSHDMTELASKSAVTRDADYLTQQRTTSTVSISQSLFSGLSGVAGVKKSKIDLQYQELQLRYMQAQISREIRRDFYALLHAQSMEKLWNETIKRLERQKEIANAWYKRQLVTKLRLLDVEVELSSSVQQRDASRTSIANAKARMAHWLALATPDELVLEGELESDGKENFPSLVECQKMARQERPDLKMTELNINRAEQEKIQVAALSLPRVDLEGGWTNFDRNYDSNRYLDEQQDYYTVALRVSMKPFQGGRNIFDWRQQLLTVEKMRQLHQEAAKAIETEVRTSYSQWEDSKARMEVSADTLRQAVEAWRLAERSLELEVGSLHDLLDAEMRRTRAEISRLESLQFRQVARANLLFAISAKWE